MIPSPRINRGDPVERTESSRLYARSLQVLPQGVSRVTIDIDPTPIYIQRGEGAYAPMNMASNVFITQLHDQEHDGI